MDQGTAQTVKEIEETRRRLDENIHELESRLPKPAVLAKRMAGVAVGGGVGGSLFWFAVRRMRKKSKKEKMKAKAKEIVSPVVVNVLPEDMIKRVSKSFEKGNWQPYAAGFGAAWLLLRLAELRQLRRMRGAMLAR